MGEAGFEDSNQEFKELFTTIFAGQFRRNYYLRTVLPSFYFSDFSFTMIKFSTETF